MKANPNRLTAQQYRESLNPKAKKKPIAKWVAPVRQSESQQQSECEGVKLDIKPLSVNAAWCGKRFKTPAYSQYEKAVLKILPEMQLPDPPYKLSFVFGFSNKASDLDNPVKMIQDILSKKYGFNDKLITELNIKKEIVKKGAEFIAFQIHNAA